MSDEDGWDNGSEPPAEEEQQEGTRRVRPLFRFRRNKKEPEQTPPPPEAVDDGTDHHDEDDPSSSSRVRPVRVVKFVPSSDSETSEQDVEEVPFEATEEIQEEDMDAAFAEVEEEPPFAEAEDVIEGEALFEEAEEVVEVEAPFTEAEDSPEGEAPFVETEDVTEWEAPFEEAEGIIEEEAFSEPELVPQEDPTFEAAEEVVEEQGLSEEMSYAVDEEVGEVSTFTEEAAEETPTAVAELVDNVPEVPFAVIEEAEREALGTETVSAEEEPEVGQDLEFRQEETPVRFQPEGSSPAPGHDAGVPLGTPEDGEVSKPHYHKYLKPDEDILHRTPTRGRPSGFDQDLESEAEEIDFGIDLIDPSDQKKKKAPKKGPKEPGGPAKGPIGGHDADGEVGTRELGMDIGVDYSKRRKRRL